MAPQQKKKNKHTNGDRSTLGKQHAMHELVRLGSPEQEFNDNGIDWSGVRNEA